MLTINTVIATFEENKFKAVTRSLWQYDYGQILIIRGLDLPSTFEVHFNNLNQDTSTTLIGCLHNNEYSVSIPDIYLISGITIVAYIYLHTGDSDGETVYTISIPVNQRSRPTHDVPTPVQQSEIEQTLAALNSAVEASETNVLHYPKIIDGYWYVWDGNKKEWVNTDVSAVGEDGVGIKDVYINPDFTLTIVFTDDTEYTTPSLQGPPGKVYDVNTGREIKIWFGTLEEFNAIEVKDPDTDYRIQEG